jgi:acetate kinase
VDPGALLYLLRADGLTVQALAALLNEESGLRGLAGESDMRVLLASPDPEVRLAVELYCYRARKYLGAYLAVLGGADAILFGGGVGEHAPTVRARILAGLEWAGIRLDAAANAAAGGGERRISVPDSRVEIWVVTVDEEAILAEEALQVLANGGAMSQAERRTT